MRLALAALICFISLGAAAAEGPLVNEDAQIKLLLEGQRQIRGVQLAEAAETFTKIIATYEEAYKGRTVFSAATDVQARALVEAAKAEGREAVDVGSIWADAHHYRGIALLRAGKFDEARKALAQAIALSPYHAPYRLEVAFSFTLQERWGESLAPFRTAQELVQKWMPERQHAFWLNRAYRGEGFSLARLGFDEQAAVLLDKALGLNPEDEAVREELNAIDRRLGR